MCAVSMISDYYKPQFPWVSPGSPIPWTPTTYPWGYQPTSFPPSFPPTPRPKIMDAEILKKIRKLLQDAQEIDDALGEVDCSTTVNDKAQLQQQLNDFIQKQPPSGTAAINPYLQTAQQLQMPGPPTQMQQAQLTTIPGISSWGWSTPAGKGSCGTIESTKKAAP